MRRGLYLALLLNASCTALSNLASDTTGMSLLSDRRDQASLLVDQRIEIDAGLKLNSYYDIREQCHFNVTAYNGIVLLTGEALTDDQHQRMVEAIRVITGVRQLHDHLTIGPISSLGSRTHDTLLTTQVKTALSQVTHIPDFDNSRVKIVTERSTVYLLGLVKPEEASIATEMVRQTDGVRKVVQIFEFLPTND